MELASEKYANKWVIVQLTEEAGRPIEMIPCKWLSPTIPNYCFWPALRKIYTADRLSKAIGKLENPTEEWDSLKIRQIGKVYYDDYLNARKDLKFAIDITFDLSSFECAIKKRVPCPKRRYSSSFSELEDGNELTLKSIPKPTNVKMLSGIKVMESSAKKRISKPMTPERKTLAENVAGNSEQKEFQNQIIKMLDQIDLKLNLLNHQTKMLSDILSCLKGTASGPSSTPSKLLSLIETQFGDH